MTELDEEIRLQAIKIGDVNESHISDVYGTKVDSRAESNFNLILREYRNKSGKLTVGFLASNDFELAGFQATLNVGDYKELGVVPHTLNITDNNHYYHNGVLKMSWSNQNMMIKKGALLFEIVYQEAQKLEPIYLDLDATNEIYQSTDLSAYLLNLKYDNTNFSQNKEEVLQIHINPNPFRDATNIQIVSMERLATKYEMIDVSGKIIKSELIFLESGINEINLDRDAFPEAGIYFIRVHRKETVFVEKYILF